MPELPEVEVVRRGLAPRTVGRTIERAEILEPRSLRRQIGGPAAFLAGIEGARVAAVERRGKFLWWRLEDPDGAEADEALMTHLGMSGQLRVRDAGVAASAPVDRGEGPASDPLRHRRLTLHLDDGARVDFVDQRIFGGLWLSPLVPDSADGAASDALIPAALGAIALDLLDPRFDVASAARALRSRRAPIKSLLLQQGIVSGIGNIYADEGLWEARIRYDTPGTALTQRRAVTLLQATAEVMRRALEVGGTSFDALYVNVDGRSGYFARSLAVYGREGHPCRRCGTVIRRSVLQQRSCFHCPRCQRPATMRRP